MDKYEFLLQNGFVETTEELCKDREFLRTNPITHEAQRWFKTTFPTLCEHTSDICISDSYTLEFVVKIIMNEGFRAGSVWGKENSEKNSKASLEKEFKKFLKKQFPYVK